MQGQEKRTSDLDLEANVQEEHLKVPCPMIVSLMSAACFFRIQLLKCLAVRCLAVSHMSGF